MSEVRVLPEPPRERPNLSPFIFIPPIYDHSQIRITHDLIHHVLQCNSVESGTKKALTL